MFFTAAQHWLLRDREAEVENCKGKSGSNYHGHATHERVQRLWLYFASRRRLGLTLAGF